MSLSPRPLKLPTPVQADRAHEGCAGDLVVADAVDLDPAVVDV
jgi:hypothetical protein